MTLSTGSGLRLASALAFALAVLLGAGCEDGDGFRDHVPPRGQGSLVVDNNTYADFDLFIDGAYVTEVRDDSERIVDLSPGVHRVILDDSDGAGSFREDVDILESRLTIIHLDSDFDDGRRFVVRVEFD